MVEQATEEAIEGAALKGAKVCAIVLGMENPTKESLNIARLGMTAVSNFVKLQQSESSRTTTMAVLMHRSAADEEQFRQLVMAALPDNPVAVALLEDTRGEVEA